LVKIGQKYRAVYMKT